MARTVAVIQAQIIAFIASNNNLTYQDENNITRNITYNTSKRAFWNVLAFVIASCIAYFEQLFDQYVTNIEAQVAQSAAASVLWIQAKMFTFQWDSSNPQIVALINGVPQYPEVDDTLQIITGCSVTVDTDNSVLVKCATGNPFTELTTPQVQAAQAYISLIGDAGITYDVLSQGPDRLYIYGQVYFNGQYSAIISANVISAVTNYLQTLSQTNFNGTIKISDLENVIRGVTGVNDVTLQNVVGRNINQAYGSGTPLIVNYTLQPLAGTGCFYTPQAGYCIPEDTTGYAMGDTNPVTNLTNLQFIAQ